MCLPRRIVGKRLECPRMSRCFAKSVKIVDFTLFGAKSSRFAPAAPLPMYPFCRVTNDTTGEDTSARARSVPAPAPWFVRVDGGMGGGGRSGRRQGAVLHGGSALPAEPSLSPRARFEQLAGVVVAWEPGQRVARVARVDLGPARRECACVCCCCCPGADWAAAAVTWRAMQCGAVPCRTHGRRVVCVRV
jgi:hypothetical protein